MAFTLVFEVDIRDQPLNPFKVDTPYGLPIAAVASDALEEIDRLRAAVEYYENAISLRAPGRPPYEDTYEQ